MSDVPNGRAIARCFSVDRDDLYTVNSGYAHFDHSTSMEGSSYRQAE